MSLPPPPPLRLDETALFADLDGTLAPIVARPEMVGPDPRRRRLLRSLTTRLAGRLAVISGRALADIDRILEGDVTAVGALHGLVRRRADGVVCGPAAGPGLREAVAASRLFAGRRPGLLVEDKGLAVTLHYRASPDLGPECRDLGRRLADQHRLTVQEGDHVVELRVPGPDKGDAIAAFMAEAPFAGFRPLFLGDDLTDENGFRAAIALGGGGIVVGPRRPTLAHHALADVPAVIAWLGEGAGS